MFNIISPLFKILLILIISTSEGSEDNTIFNGYQIAKGTDKEKNSCIDECLKGIMKPH